jgi:serine protease Do
MARRFVVVTVCLVATVAFLIGLIVAGSLTPAPAQSATKPGVAALRPSNVATGGSAAVSFADVAEQLNPAVVNIDATSRASVRSRARAGTPPLPDSPDPFGRAPERERQGPRRGTGTGFIIDPDGYILTNHHVIEGADRVTVRLADGRSLRAERIGSDPDTDIALIKVSSPRQLPHAVLGDSDALRVGEWVLAIGRKLFDSSLDRYIQTDAAINFGNSGGPLINARGEVIGINAAISSRASNIGFAVPINQASLILPQLRELGRVSRGYIGVALRDVDPDLQRSLGLSSSSGALVQDVTPGSPGARAGLRPYDLIVAVDGKAVVRNDELIQLVSARQPGTSATLQIVRDGRALNVAVKLAERPVRDPEPDEIVESARPTSRTGSVLGMLVREIDVELASRFNLPKDLQGVVVSRVDPMGPAFDADIERGNILLEINRQPVHSIDDFRRLTANTRSGEVLALYLFKPEGPRRELRTVKID